MSFHDPALKNLSVSLVSASTSPVTTHYQVQVVVTDVCWSVERRYSDFSHLNAQLLSAKHLATDTLPPKKLIGNREPAFVERRRQELAAYLQGVVERLEGGMPECLAQFLALPEYDCGWMLRRLAYLCYVHESAYLADERVLEATPMQLSALQTLVDDGRADSFFREPRLGTAPSHVVAVAHGVASLLVAGSWQSLPGCSLRPNTHTFSLRLFSALSHLALSDVDMKQCQSLVPLCARLVSLSVTGAALEHLRQVLLCGELHEPHIPPGGRIPALWPLLEELSLSDNCITCLDDTVLFAPALVTLDISNNLLSSVTASLNQLQLEQLNLSNNRLTDGSGLFNRLPRSLQLLKLSANRLQLLWPLSLRQLSSLSSLDLSFNRVPCVQTLSRQLPREPLLELNLAGNPTTLAPEYRLHALLHLPGARHGRLVLDNEHSTRAELDRVNTLHALAVARGGAPGFISEYWRGRQLCQL